MNLKKAVFAGLVVGTSQVFAASPIEMCTAAGNVVRDALLAESLRVAFNELSDWHDPTLENFPPTWKLIVTKDIENFKPQLIAVVATVLKEIPAWDQQGLDGKAQARAQILKGLEMINEAYKVRCLKMLQ